ncbi:DUF504 domain-containing protein [uncultured Methanoregula sp.]|uniref:DUF504 domain-containing protein n=1 Tax=uncultured Methanoregula sp. TaxID=1005933 RepID=UPI002AAC2AB3|nr:DUF504 domain-containing protein [uncultured Methanoregula sp.]
MLTSHALLQKYWYDARYSFPEIIVCYVDRGALGDRSCAHGGDIRALEAYYFEIATGRNTRYIPYHRIRKITYGGLTIWEHSSGQEKRAE